MQELTIKNIPLKVLEKMNLPLTSEMFNEIANFNDNLKPDFGYPTLKDTPDIKFNEISEDVPEYVKNFLLNKITQKLEEGIVTIESEDEEKISIELFTDASSFILNPVELLEVESLTVSDIDIMSEIQFILKETNSNERQLITKEGMGSSGGSNLFLGQRQTSQNPRMSDSVRRVVSGGL